MSEGLEAKVDELLRRTGWKRIRTQEDMPPRHQHCLVWMRGGEIAAQATCNFDIQGGISYFLLGQSGARRAMEEVTHWMPLPAGPGPDDGSDDILRRAFQALQDEEPAAAKRLLGKLVKRS